MLKNILKNINSVNRIKTKLLWYKHNASKFKIKN